MRRSIRTRAQVELLKVLQKPAHQAHLQQLCPQRASKREPKLEAAKTEAPAAGASQASTPAETTSGGPDRKTEAPAEGASEASTPAETTSGGPDRQQAQEEIKHEANDQAPWADTAQTGAAHEAKPEPVL